MTRAAALSAMGRVGGMSSRHGLLAALAAAFLVTAGSAQANVLISIDKSSQHMTVSVDGVKRHSWPVSTGRSGYATPSGNYTPFRMEEDHYSKEWDDAPMPHSIFFTPKGHAIHGSYEVKRLGSAASHGCVRLSPKNAETLFALVKSEGMNNTKVVLTGQAPPLVARRPATQDTASEPMELQQYRSQGQADRQAYQDYAQPQYAQPQYGQRYPQYGQQYQYQQPQYQQPRYYQPYAQRSYGYDPRFDPRY
jgi:L,D-transpeptidase-like protein